ncbi:2OG-Fe(II) oxygenase [Burkholderia dolosa]|uniref:2OG-Fe(II) oxygenase n=1 Tax=Burkholderia dolosa TaxID=152500 RepID=UPI001B90DAD5|nr:2OG-Fe(II) oxygenase [Burkholderia dolosa]MBR8058261.1 2OG-Fe(II) oxygenase [Burkholderia dolosa]MBR8456403.1 2OG-Fe(II) oxygenase [Burkholderia dolosa]MDN7422165.1 2OG-Fe(II) oxygenase [Burkholderia dolosa]
MLLDESWRTWVIHNKSRGCTPESMIEMMVDAGFGSDEAKVALETTVADHGDMRGVEAAMPVRKYGEYQYDACPIADGNVIDAADRRIPVLIRCERPQIVVFGNVLDQDECDEMIQRSMHKLEQSTTVNAETGTQEVIRHRTSHGTWFQNGEDALIRRIETRLAALMNCPVENGEGLQVLRYTPGGEYRSHYDYFQPTAAGSLTHVRTGGQRVATLIVYLNDVPSGGETVFPEAGISVVPRRGDAVYFRYMNRLRQLDPATLHAGAPVRDGEKWIMTKWVRERPYV